MQMKNANRAAMPVILLHLKLIKKQIIYYENNNLNVSFKRFSIFLFYTYLRDFSSWIIVLLSTVIKGIYEIFVWYNWHKNSEWKDFINTSDYI